MVQTISGREKIDGRQCSLPGHLFITTDNILIVIVSTLLDKDRQMMVQKMEGASGIPKTTIYQILTTGQWVTDMLFPTQKWCHMELCQKHWTRYKKERIAFLQRIIAIDESWVRDFELELKSRSEVWKGKIRQDCKNSDADLRRWNKLW